jgi:hypothetical protein
MTASPETNLSIIRAFWNCSDTIFPMCTRYNIMWSSLSVTCDRWMVFSGYSGFRHLSNDVASIEATEAVASVKNNCINIFFYERDSNSQLQWW